MSTKVPDLNKYRNCIRQLLTEHAEFVSSNDDIEAQIIADVEGDHYQLLYIKLEIGIIGLMFKCGIVNISGWAKHSRFKSLTQSIGYGRECFSPTKTGCTQYQHLSK